MARPVWNGTLSFGLVSIPVSLVRAVRQHDLSFHQLDRESGARVRYRKVAEGSDESLPADRIARGFEVADGRYVLVEDEDLAQLAPVQSRTLQITDFVELAEIDPLYFDQGYYLAPRDGAEHAYELLRRTMADSGRVAVATFVMRSREHLAVVRSADDALVVSTLVYADELLGVDQVPGLPVQSELDDRETAVARTLIEQMTVPWEPERYHDTYQAQLRELIDAKARGETVAPEQPAAAPVLDLMEALRRSVEQHVGTPTQETASSAAQDADTAVAEQTAAEVADDLSGMSRDDLYALARRLDVPGRSRMSRDDLVGAVRAARVEQESAHRAAS